MLWESLVLFGADCYAYAWGTESLEKNNIDL